MSSPVVSLAEARKARQRPEPGVDKRTEQRSQRTTAEPDARRARRLAMNNWRSNVSMIQFRAPLMDDAELIWFAGIERKTPEDALRLRGLREALFQRSNEEDERQRREERRRFVQRLKRLGIDPERLGIWSGFEP
jgi:hypothetical protein